MYLWAERGGKADEKDRNQGKKREDRLSEEAKARVIGKDKRGEIKGK